MNWEKMVENAWSYGIAGVFAFIMLWWVLDRSSADLAALQRDTRALQESIRRHDEATTNLLREICAGTNIGKRDTAACFR